MDLKSKILTIILLQKLTILIWNTEILNIIYLLYYAASLFRKFLNIQKEKVKR